MAEKINSSVFWTSGAIQDLNDIVEYIAKDRLLASIDIYYKIKETCSNLKNFQEHGRVVPEMKDLGINRYRELVIDAWRVVYVINKEGVFITAVYDSRRNIEKILFDRMIGKY